MAGQFQNRKTETYSMLLMHLHANIGHQ